MGGLGTSTKHLFSELTKHSTTSKHRMFSPLYISVTSKIKLLSIHFLELSGRTESRGLICIRHQYQNDKICKPRGPFKSYDNRSKDLGPEIADILNFKTRRKVA